MSFANQQPAPSEIIVVDDGSTDDSVAVLDRLSGDIPSLRIVRRTTRGGPVAALNTGIQAATGEYVCFGAADDLLLPGTLAALTDIALKHPQAAFTSCEALVVEVETGSASIRPPVRPAQETVYISPAETVRLLRRIDNWILTGAALIRRDLVLAEGAFDETLGPFSDGYLMRCLALRHGHCFVPHLGLIWRVSLQGYSRRVATDPKASQRLLDTVMRRMSENDVFPLWYPTLFGRRWRFSIGRLAAKSRPINRVILTTVSARGPVDRAVLSTAARIDGWPGKFMALVWLTLREQPMSLSGLASTYVSRRMAGQQIDCGVLEKLIDNGSKDVTRSSYESLSG